MPGENWLEEIVPLRRPEYARQTEVLLTDLIWRSPGSSFGTDAGSNVPRFRMLTARQRTDNGAPLERLVPRRTRAGSQKLTETFEYASSSDTGSLFSVTGDVPGPVEALLTSITAPRSRGTRSVACVPIYRDAIAFQTLHGLVNKANPANLASIAETVGWLGGAEEEGDVARQFLEATQASSEVSTSGAAIEDLVHLLAETVWSRLEGDSEVSDGGTTWRDWTTPAPSARNARRPSETAALRGIPTPFSWFWDKWQTLCNTELGWHKKLPARRFIDWALCLLRTGLAFAYLWESEFYLRIYSALGARSRGEDTNKAFRPLRNLLEGGPVLAKIEPRSVPAAQKHAWPSIRSHLARGYVAREKLQDLAGSQPAPPPDGPLTSRLTSWIERLSGKAVEGFISPPEPESRTAKNQQEFVRYLLQQRSSDDDSADQADLYYLLEQDSRSTWFDPGPEWIVVVASLLCRRPGGQCTLSQVLSDFSQLGLQAERSVVTNLLEAAGLSTDSPDADQALVVNSGF